RVNLLKGEITHPVGPVGSGRDIIKHFEHKGFCLVAMKFCGDSEKHLNQHFVNLKNRPFPPLACEMHKLWTCVAIVWEVLNAVKTGRMMLGQTNSKDSKPGTIRGDISRNIMCGSDSVKSAEKEINLLWLKPKELTDYKSCAHD
uniref:nucleoside-diphosphate kinase n=1 Tax=Monodelphis domestica TaxID=13616 RepID=A0A5F8GAN8_MONDO